jgi:hypothetical protein
MVQVNEEAIAVHTRTPLFLVLDVATQKLYMYNSRDVHEKIQNCSKILQKTLQANANPVPEDIPEPNVKYEYIHPSGIPMYIYAYNTDGNSLPSCIRGSMIEIGRRIVEREQAEIKQSQRTSHDTLKKYIMIGSIGALSVIGLYLYMQLGGV